MIFARIFNGWIKIKDPYQVSTGMILDDQKNCAYLSRMTNGEYLVKIDFSIMIKLAILKILTYFQKFRI